MGMSDENVGDRFPLRGLKYGLDMFRVCRSGVDYSNVALSKYVGTCTVKREGTRVIGDHSSYTG